MKVYVFGGSKEEPNWYFTKCRLDPKPMIGWNKEKKRLRCIFFAWHTLHSGGCYCLSLLQLMLLPFKHRLYFSEERAKARQRRNYVERYGYDVDRT